MFFPVWKEVEKSGSEEKSGVAEKRPDDERGSFEMLGHFCSVYTGSHHHCARRSTYEKAADGVDVEIHEDKVNS